MKKWQTIVLLATLLIIGYFVVASGQMLWPFVSTQSDEVEIDIPCSADEPIGHHPDGSEIWYRPDDRVDDSLCTEDGWIYDPLPDEEVEEVIEEDTSSALDEESPEENDEEVKVDEPVAESGCPPARDIGPWAPNNGLGEDFEVTCNETNCVATHIQLWWPAGSGQEWDTQEISVFLPPGLSIEVQDGAGRGWEYALSCSLEEIESQMVADNDRRSNDTSYFGRVDIDDLIDTGLVVVRFDRR